MTQENPYRSPMDPGDSLPRHRPLPWGFWVSCLLGIGMSVVGSLPAAAIGADLISDPPDPFVGHYRDPMLGFALLHLMVGAVMCWGLWLARRPNPMRRVLLAAACSTGIGLQPVFVLLIRGFVGDFGQVSGPIGSGQGYEVEADLAPVVVWAIGVAAGFAVPLWYLSRRACRAHFESASE